MYRYAMALVAAVVATPALAGPVAPAGTKGTSYPFPTSAPVVVVLNGYETARARLGALLAAALPTDAPTVAKAFDAELGKLLDGRKLTAVRKDARTYLVVHDAKSLFESGGAITAVVPVTAADKFRDTFLTAEELKGMKQGAGGVHSATTSSGRTIYLTDLKDHVAVSFDELTASGYAADYPAATADAMGADLAASFEAADLGVYVGMPAIVEAYRNEVQAAKRLLEFIFQQAIDQGKLPGVGKIQFGGMKVAIRGVFQGIRDCRGLVLAAEFRPDGLLLRAHAQFTDKSPTAQLMKAEASGPLAAMGRLPAGFGEYVECRLGDGFRDVMPVLTMKQLPADDDEKGAAALERSWADRLAAGPGGAWYAQLDPGAEIAVTEFKDPAKGARAAVDAFRAVGPGGFVSRVYVKGAPEVADATVKHRGLTFTEVRLRLDLDTTAGRLPEGAARDAMLAQLKRTRLERPGVWIGADDRTVIQLTAKDWASAKAALDAYLDGKPVVGSEDNFKAVQKHLPSRATAVLLSDVGVVVWDGAELLRAVGPTVPGVPAIPDLRRPKGPPVYAGVAVSMSGDTGMITAFVPADAAVVVTKMLSAAGAK